MKEPHETEITQTLLTVPPLLPPPPPPPLFAQSQGCSTLLCICSPDGSVGGQNTPELCCCTGTPGEMKDSSLGKKKEP